MINLFERLSVLPYWIRLGLIFSIIHLPYSLFPDAIIFDASWVIPYYFIYIIPILPISFHSNILVTVSDFPVPTIIGIVYLHFVWFGIGAIIGYFIDRRMMNVSINLGK